MPERANNQQELQNTHDEVTEAYGFEIDKRKVHLTWLGYLFTIGFLRLIFHWLPRFHLFATHKKCSLSRATKVLLINVYKKEYITYNIEKVKKISTRNVKANTFFSVNSIEEQSLLDNMKDAELEINLENRTKLRALEFRTFWYRRQCYIWDHKKLQFSKLATLGENISCSELNPNKIEGLTREEQILRRIIYGDNKMHVPVQSLTELFLLETLDPFYVFQILSLVLWYITSYYYFTTLVILLILGGLTSSILQTRKNQISLRDTIASTALVKVVRSDGTFESISSAELVPGDIMELPKRQGTIVCDAVLLTGTCVVDESALTGESVPVFKTPLYSSMNVYDSKEHSSSTLFCGTSIIQSNAYGNKPVLAKVIRTGLQTYEGSLVLSILYLPVTGLKFEKDLFKVLLVLVLISTIGCIYTIVIEFIHRPKGENGFFIVIDGLITYSSFISPTLLIIMVSGTIYARSKLKKQKIHCTKPKSINMCGAINCICFDKTGTLTENDLNLMGIVPIENGEFKDFTETSKLQANHHMFRGMLTCHNLSLIEKKIAGDPMEVQMFKSTGWRLEEQEIEDIEDDGTQMNTIIRPPSDINFGNTSEVIILNRYQFSSSLRRMSVIVKIKKTDELWCYCKGSPEMILSLSKLETRPKEFDKTLQKYTKQGYRVIAFGCSRISEDHSIQIQDIPRKLVETNLDFLGFIIYENKVKSASAGVIKELRNANMKTIMVTGDNIETAVCVAKECGILSNHDTVIYVTITKEQKIHFEVHTRVKNQIRSEDENDRTLQSVENGLRCLDYKFVMIGTTWNYLQTHHVEMLQKICVRGAIFARMSSDQKKQLITQLINLGFYVAMCGDGVNDCEALRAAHAGLSLSEAEASVASPFTSQIPDISCMTILIKEGRAALATSFGCFKFTICYAAIESFSVIVLNSIGSNLSNFELIVEDMVLALIFNLILSVTKTYKGPLAKKPPMTSLISFVPMLSIGLNMVLMDIVQLAVFFLVRQQSWFTPFKKRYRVDYFCYENYTLASIAFFQIIITAILFPIGTPYNQPMYTHYPFVTYVLITTILCLYIVVYPASWVADLMEMKMPPLQWRLIIVGVALLNFFIYFIFEKIILRYIEKRVNAYKLKRPNKLYLKIQQQLETDNNWPLVDEISYDFIDCENNPCSSTINAKEEKSNKNLTVYDNETFTQDDVHL